jgi:hypothetical protein
MKIQLVIFTEKNWFFIKRIFANIFTKK